MRHSAMIVLLVGTLLAFPATTIAEETIDTVEKKIVETFDQYDSMTYKLTMTMEAAMGGMTMTGKGEGASEYMKKGDKSLFRQEMTITVENSMSPGQPMTSNSTIICDGEFVYTVQEQGSLKQAFKQNIADTDSAPGGKMMFENLKKNSNLKLLLDEKINGEEAYVIEVVPKQVNPMGGPTKIKRYIIKKTAVPAKLEMFGPDGKVMMTITMSDVKIDPKIDPSRFVFKAPEGVQVNDQTGGS
jgi:outer membrane lipoprotein-sorting protein